MNPKYKGLIWTNHAIQRMRERGISQSDAWATWNHPESSRKGTAPNSYISYRTYNVIKIEVASKKNKNGEWVILSVWSRPVYKKHSGQSFWGRILSVLGLN